MQLPQTKPIPGSAPHVPSSVVKNTVSLFKMPRDLLGLDKKHFV